MLNGVFVSAEFAVVRVRRTRLEELAEAKEAADDLAVTQIGITVASLGVGWFGESAFLAVRKAEHLLLALARPLQLLHVFLRPLHRLFDMRSTRILRALRHGEGPRTPQRRLRAGGSAPDQGPVDLRPDGILRRLQEGHGQMGIVRDRDDHKTLGIVTLEDVLESLVGDVREAPRGERAP